jgi:hypothetical protein
LPCRGGCQNRFSFAVKFIVNFVVEFVVQCMVKSVIKLVVKLIELDGQVLVPLHRARARLPGPRVRLAGMRIRPLFDHYSTII